jgi:hypothetical protein
LCEEVKARVEKLEGLVSLLMEEMKGLYNKTTILEPLAVPLGTIVASLLLWEVSRQVIPKADEFWVPADRCELPPSCQLRIRTQQTHAPDLRGMFLRGLNKLGADREARPGGGDPDTRVVGQEQGDSVGRHDHRMRGDFANVPHGGGGHALGYLDRHGEYRTTFHEASETRPRNVAVYYYLRVN